MSRSNACTLLLLCAFAVSPVRAQIVPVVTPDQPLLLEEAIAQAVRKNFDLQIQSYTTNQAKETLMIAQAGFDPNLTATARRNINQAASNISRLDGAQTEGPRNDNTTVSVGVNERIATNGTVALSANITRGATNSTNALLNPTFGNGISASISQPLLRCGPFRHRSRQARRRDRLHQLQEPGAHAHLPNGERLLQSGRRP